MFRVVLLIRVSLKWARVYEPGPELDPALFFLLNSSSRIFPPFYLTDGEKKERERKKQSVSGFSEKIKFIK